MTLSGLSKGTGSPIFSSPCPNIWKYLYPRIIYFKFAEIFGPLEQTFQEYLDLLKIEYFIPHYFTPMHCLRGIINLT